VIIVPAEEFEQPEPQPEPEPQEPPSQPRRGQLSGEQSEGAHDSWMSLRARFQDFIAHAMFVAVACLPCQCHAAARIECRLKNCRLNVLIFYAAGLQSKAKEERKKGAPPSKRR